MKRKNRILIIAFFLLIGLLWFMIPGRVKIKNDASVHVSIEAEEVSGEKLTEIQKIIAQARYTRIPIGETSYPDLPGTVIVTIKNNRRAPENLYFVPGSAEPWFYSVNGIQFRLKNGEKMYQDILRLIR